MKRAWIIFWSVGQPVVTAYVLNKIWRTDLSIAVLAYTTMALLLALAAVLHDELKKWIATYDRQD